MREPTQLVPRWLPPLFVAAGVALAPWIVWLVATLPSRQVATHWEIAWGGFDVALALLLVCTGVTLARRSPAAEVFASMAGAFLICDAWFDVTTAHDRMQLVVAVFEALLAELPLAIACLWIARNIERVLADRRPLREVVRLRSAAPDEYEEERAA
jgi:hypothetical protein